MSGAGEQLGALVPGSGSGSGSGSFDREPPGEGWQGWSLEDDIRDSSSVVNMINNKFSS